METKFNFTSQLCTSKIQSERLLALGLKKETADMRWANCMGNSSGTTYYLQVGAPYYDCDIPAWSLHRLMILAATPLELDEMLGYNVYDYYDNAINHIESLIKEGYFPKEYLV